MNMNKSSWDRNRSKDQSRRDRDENDSRSNRNRDRNEHRSGSSTSLQEKRSATSSNRQNQGRADNDALIALLTNDFMVMLENSPQPEEVFGIASPEYKLAWLWLNKLSTMSCNTLYERRMRNAYMSHLSVCFNQRRLYGIFMEMPPDELVWVNFTDNHMEATNQSINLARACAMQATANMMQNTSGVSGRGTCCSQQQEPSASKGCCMDQSIPNASRYAGGGGGKRLKCSQTNLSPRSLSSPPKLSPSVRRVDQLANDFTCTKDCLNDTELVRIDKRYLLDIIKKELRGEQSEETDSYLEYELKRYREFDTQHQHDDPDFRAKINKDPAMERVHLLLNMQNDLIKLLSD